MFISSDYLGMKYGVDATIAKFFVDRDPPGNNLYWKDKLLYLRPAPGYLFIPLITDLLYRIGVDRDQLLSEVFVAAMEQIGHISAMEETGKISMPEAVEKCAALVKPNCTNKEWYTNLINYFNQAEPDYFSPLASPYKALHRGDVFLFSICALNFPEEKTKDIISCWFSLITTLLLQDDVEDFEKDQQTGDENALLESGLKQEAILKLLDFVENNLENISTLNSTMASGLRRQFKLLVDQNSIFKFLKRGY